MTHPTTVDPAEVFVALGALVRRLSHRPLPITDDLRAALATTGPIGPRHVSVLGELAVTGECSVGDLATRLGLGLPAVSEVVADLARIGVVTRHADPADGRRVLVGVAPDHTELATQLLGCRLRPISAALGQLRPAEQRALVTGLAALAAALDAPPCPAACEGARP